MKARFAGICTDPIEKPPHSEAGAEAKHASCAAWKEWKEGAPKPPRIDPEENAQTKANPAQQLCGDDQHPGPLLRGSVIRGLRRFGYQWR